MQRKLKKQVQKFTKFYISDFKRDRILLCHSFSIVLYCKRIICWGEVMKCNGCNNTFNNEYRYCPYCGMDSSQNNNASSSIHGGVNNINIGLGNNSTQEIYIDKFNITKQSDDLVVEYSDRLHGKVIGGVNGYKRKFEIAGILSIVSALVTIVDYLLTKSNFTVFFLLCAMGLFVYAIDSRDKLKELKKNGIVYRDQKPILVEENGEVYKVKKYGVCPICNGRVYIYYDERFKRKLGKCVNNNDHLYTYDHTIDAGVPYEVINFYHSK